MVKQKKLPNGETISENAVLEGEIKAGLMDNTANGKFKVKSLGDPI